MNLTHFVIDPSSGEESCSRLGLLLMNIGAVVAIGVMLYVGKDPTSLLIGMAQADAAVYGVNSFGRFLKRGTAKPAPDTP
jgi:hypothetical protein